MFSRTITVYGHHTSILTNCQEGSRWRPEKVREGEGALRRTREEALDDQRKFLIEVSEDEIQDIEAITDDSTLCGVKEELYKAGYTAVCRITEVKIDILPEERGLLPQYLTEVERDLVDNMYVYNEVLEEEKNDQIYEICNILTLKQMDAIGIVRTGSAGINKRYAAETSDVRDMLYLAFLSLVSAYIQVKLREPDVEK